MELPKFNRRVIGAPLTMFKHFVGEIYVLESPPPSEETQLNLTFTEDLLADVDEEQFRGELSPDQVAAIIDYKENMVGYLGKDSFQKLQEENAFQTSDYKLLRRLAASMKDNPDEWKQLRILNFDDTEYWANILFKIMKFQAGGWDTTHTNIVNFVKVISNSWNRSIPELLTDLSAYNLGIEDLFQFERKLSFNLAALLGDINTI